MSGVPRGSILGPLLFVLYVNDIPTYLSCPTEMFADDTVIHNHCSPSSISDSVQSGLKQVEVCKKKKTVEDWCNTWLLGTNAKKM